mgnify:CR=1 FL=1
MGDDERIEIRFPKGKLKPKHVAIIIIFMIFMYFLVEALKSALATQFQNQNVTIFIIALILIVIVSFSTYVVYRLSKETE